MLEQRWNQTKEERKGTGDQNIVLQNLQIHKVQLDPVQVDPIQKPVRDEKVDICLNNSSGQLFTPSSIELSN